MTEQEFCNRSSHLNGLDDAETLVSLGLGLLEGHQRRQDDQAHD